MAFKKVEDVEKWKKGCPEQAIPSVMTELIIQTKTLDNRLGKALANLVLIEDPELAEVVGSMAKVHKGVEIMLASLPGLASYCKEESRKANPRARKA